MAKNTVTPDQAYQSALDRTNQLIPQRRAFAEWQMKHSLDLENQARDDMLWQRDQLEAERKRFNVGTFIKGLVGGGATGASAGSVAGPYGAIAGGALGMAGGGAAAYYGGENGVSSLSAINSATPSITGNLSKYGNNQPSQPGVGNVNTGFTPAGNFGNLGLNLNPPSNPFTGSANGFGQGAVAAPISNKTDKAEETSQDASAGPFTKKAKKLAKGK